MHWLCCSTEEFTQEALQQVYHRLSPSRKERLDRLRRREDKMRSLAAEALVYKLLEQKWSITDGVLHTGPEGQPYLSGCDLFVSISHCDAVVACAVSREPVGIDVERIRPMDMHICRHVCVAEESAYVLGDALEAQLHPCTDPQVLERFFEVWTAKEAWFKKCGTGITDLKSVNILPMARKIYRMGDYMIQII